MSNTEHVVSYYDNCQIDYELVWHLRSHLSMHYGYWSNDTNTLREALIEMNHQLADMADIRHGEIILDAGCGVGGSSIFLAKEYGCKVTGITLSEKQVSNCQENARINEVLDIVKFEKADYLNTPYPDASFDVIWAIESVCYADRKSEFLKEAYRILKPGGRVIVADFYSNKKKMDENEKKIMDKWTDCWAINTYAQKDSFNDDLHQAGFEDIKVKEATENVLPSIMRLYYLFFPGIVVTKLGELLGLRNSVQTANTWSTYYQYKAYKKDLWSYCLFKGLKN